MMTPLYYSQYLPKGLQVNTSQRYLHIDVTAAPFTIADHRTSLGPTPESDKETVDYYTHNGNFLSTDNNEIVSLVGKLMQPEITLLS